MTGPAYWQRAARMGSALVNGRRGSIGCHFPGFNGLNDGPEIVLVILDKPKVILEVAPVQSFALRYLLGTRSECFRQPAASESEIQTA